MKLKNLLQRYDVQIYIGSQVGYNKVLYPKKYVEQLCQSFCDTDKVAVTVTDTQFFYPEGNEPGFIIGLINYPRFPSTEGEVFDHALALAEWLTERLDQFRCSIFTPEKIYLFENENIDPELMDRT